MIIEVNKNHKSVVVSHPAQQHSYMLSKSLVKGNYLHSYCTTIYYRRNKWLYKILSKVLDDNNFKRLKNRRLECLDNRTISFNELAGLLYLFIVRADKIGNIRSWYENILGDLFGRSISQYIKKNNVKVVVAYDKFAYKCFYNLRNTSVIKILDMSSIPIRESLDVIKKDYENSRDFKDSYDKAIRTMDNKALYRNNAEINMSDYFIVASEYTKNAIMSHGVDKNKIFVARYGIDVSKYEIKSKKRKNEKLRFLFVGRVSATKGIHHLIEAFKKLEKNNVELCVVGSVESSAISKLENYEWFRYLGIKTHDEMAAIYSEADVFILPTMYDGASLAILEAMASGLPVVSSINAGNSELICDGENGFVYEPEDLIELERIINWFVNNRYIIPEMGYRARKTSEYYTVENYEKRVVEIFEEIFRTV